MAKAARQPSPQELLRGHYDAVAGLVGRGVSEVEVNAALTAAEQAGLDRVALAHAVREGRLDRERRAEVAVALDVYRAMLDPPPPLPGLDPPELTGQPGRHHGPRGAPLK